MLCTVYVQYICMWMGIFGHFLLNLLKNTRLEQYAGQGWFMPHSDFTSTLIVRIASWFGTGLDGCNINLLLLIIKQKLN